MKFRLQKVLDLRAAQEKMAQQELAVRLQDHQMIVYRIERLLQDEKTLFELIKHDDESGVDLPRLQHLYTCTEELKKELSEQEIKREESLGQVERQREAVRECWQKRRMLEILKNRAAVLFMKTMQKEEQKQLDELVLFAFTNNSRKQNEGR